MNVFGKAWQNLRAIPRSIRDAFLSGDDPRVHRHMKEKGRRLRQIAKGREPKWLRKISGSRGAALTDSNRGVVEIQG